MKDLHEVKRYLEYRTSKRDKEPLPFKVTEILPLLEKHLKDSDTFVRRLALDVLFLLESKDCVYLLEQSLKDNYPYHRSLAFHTLAKIYEPSIFPILDNAINNETESKTRWDMLYHLHLLNDKAFLPTLSKWILKADKSNAYIIQTIIEKFKYKELIPTILEYAQQADHDANSKNAIVKILGLLQATQGLDFILEHIGYQFAPDVFSDATCLIALVDMNAPDLYLEKLDKVEGRKLQVLIDALGILKYSKATNIFILELQKNKNIDIQIALLKALQNLSYPIDNEKDKILLELANNNWSVAEKNSEIVRHLLTQLSLSNNAALALKSMQFLGKNHLLEGMENLIQQINSPDNRYRIQAIISLGEMGNAKAIPALVNYLQSDSSKEPYFDRGRELAVKALGKIGDVAVVPFLVELLKNNPSISGKGDCLSNNSKAIVQVLMDFYATEGIPIFVEYLLHPNAILRGECINALKLFNWQPDHLQNKIRWLAANKDWNNISNLGSLAVKPLMRIVENKNIFGHTDLMLALAKIGDQQALDAVLTWLFQPRYHFHNQNEIDKLLPYFQPLLGNLANHILQAAAFIDCIVTEDGSSTYYAYSLKTAIEATKILKKSSNPLASKALLYVLQKKPIFLVDAEHEEYGSGNTEFRFSEQFKYC